MLTWSATFPIFFPSLLSILFTILHNYRIMGEFAVEGLCGTNEIIVIILRSNNHHH